MRRGSACSWGPFAERNTANMAQCVGNQVQFMTAEEIKFDNEGGWFVSYGKAGCIVTVVLLVVILAGFVGAYIVTPPRKDSRRTPQILSDEIEDADVIATTSILSFIRPTRYRLELTPVIANDSVSKFTGRVIIEFQVEGKARLKELPLNAMNIKMTRYKLHLVSQGEADAKGRRKRNDEEHFVTAVTRENTTDRLFTKEIATFDNDTESSTLGDVDLQFTRNDSRTDPEFTNSTKIEMTTTTDDRRDGIESTEIGIERYEANVIDGLHVMHLAVKIGRGSYFLEIDYEVPVDDKAIYSTSEFESDGRKLKWMSGTVLKSTGARRLLPLFDDVRYKCLFNVSVARPKDVMVLSNMPLETSRDISDDWILDTFVETPLFLPHNLAFVIGDIRTINRTQLSYTDIPVTFWGDVERESQGMYILDKIDSVISNLIDEFEISYPLPKLDVVGLPPGIITDTGNPGLISIRDSSFYATHSSPIITRMNALSTLIHLVGEQWLGGVVSMGNWSDAWILEGSLLCLQHSILSKIDSSFDRDHSFVADVQSIAMDVDGFSVSKSLRAKVNSYYTDTSKDLHGKGACLIRMLHGAINNTAFRDGYQKFINRWTNETATSTAFWDIMGEDSSELPSGMTLEEVMDPWISQRGYPVVFVMRNYEEGDATIRQERFSYDQLGTESESENVWYIPLTYITENGDWSVPSKFWLTSREETLRNVSSPGERSWILFNINKTGYYRVHYDDDNWKLLAAALEENHEIFSPETRASLIDDIFSLAADGLTKYEAAFDFIKYMQTKERHYAPWSTLMRHMLKLNNILYSTPLFPEFQEFMLKLVTPLYEEVHTSFHNGSQLALMSIQMACTFDHEECLEWADVSFDEIRNNTANVSDVPTYILETLYCTIARYGTPDEWFYFLEKLATITDREEKNSLLSAFACFQVPWILQSILNKVLSEAIFTDDEVEIILKEFPKNSAAAQIAYRFIRVNWHDIVKRFWKSYSVLTSFILATIGGLTTEQDLQDLQAFLENHYDTLKYVQHATATVEANAYFATSWLMNSLPDVQEWLTNNSFVAQ